MNASGKPRKILRPASTVGACRIQLNNPATTSLQLAASTVELDLRPRISPLLLIVVS
jgi:hypothetical protein